MAVQLVAPAIAVVIGLAVWLGVVVKAFIRGKPVVCPRCSAKGSIHRSIRKPVEMVLPRFVRPYRCNMCDKRFYAIRSVDYT